jgi:ankyrin repeat protein
MLPRINVFLKLSLLICFISIVLLGQKKVEPVKPQIPQTQDFCFNVVKAGQGGCSVGEDIPYGTPLLEAIHQRDVNEIKRLISEGANVNEADKNGLTPILLVSRGDLELIDIFLKANATISAEGKYRATPLSASTICSKAVKRFLDAGADVNQKDINKKTALMYAAENKNIEAIKLLIEAGADIYDKDLSDMTPLLYALKSGSLEIAKFFYSKDKRTLSDELDRLNAFWITISNSQIEAVEFLLKEGISSNKPSDLKTNISSPITIAAMRDNTEIG